MADTIAQILHKASTELAAVSDSAKLDARLLLAKALDKPNSYLLTWPERSPSVQQAHYFQQLLKRRLCGEPIAHILGEKEFWSLPLKVSTATLIPRPDTETLVEQALALFDDSPIQCLDLGTGTGAIALALASERSLWQIDAVDISADAVALAKQNQQNLNIQNVNIFQSNWFESVNKHDYQLIVSNPPYIDEHDKHLFEGDVRFEPKTALVADDGGLADIKQIITCARSHLVKNGYVLIEHGYQQAEQVSNLLKQAGFKSVTNKQDLAGQPRVTIGRWQD